MQKLSDPWWMSSDDDVMITSEGLQVTAEKRKSFQVIMLRNKEKEIGKGLLWMMTKIFLKIQPSFCLHIQHQYEDATRNTILHVFTKNTFCV